MSMETDIRAKGNEKEIVGVKARLDDLEAKSTELNDRVSAISGPQEKSQDIQKPVDAFSKEELLPVLSKMADQIKKLQGMIVDLQPRSRKFTKRSSNLRTKKATEKKKKEAADKKAAEDKAKAQAA